jgi:tRNA modification GTPase
MTPSADTIAAISTPPGRGGIGIVRLSGPDAFRIAAQLLDLAAKPLAHAHARYTRVFDPTDPARTLDEAVATAFHAPHSYTGEDVVEIATHGSPVILDAVLEAALAAGARLADPGEFTQRAFASGRLDLTQAEAVHDLIAARTLDAARQAAQQLGGSLARRLAPTKERLLHLIALLEAGMDFASGELDDVDVVPPTHIAAEVAAVTAQLEALAATYRRGQLLRTGAALALVGRPNAGKSSLFNRLLERDRAIVTPIPGTTRDTVEEAFALAGIPLRLVDTAGLRDLAEALDHPADEAEAQGIARSREALADADLILLIHDATVALTPAERDLLASLAHRPHLLIENKADLLATEDAKLETQNTVFTSALTGEGLEALRTAILEQLHAGAALQESAALTNPRQMEALQQTLAALHQAAAANHEGLPHEILLVDLHTALRALDSLTGQTTSDDILARIFSTFCIGK